MLATPVSNKMELFCKLVGLLEHRNRDVQSEHAGGIDMQTRKTKVIGKVLWLCRHVRIRWVHGEEKDEFITVLFSGPKAMHDTSDPGVSALSLPSESTTSRRSAPAPRRCREPALYNDSHLSISCDVLRDVKSTEWGYHTHHMQG